MTDDKIQKPPDPDSGPKGIKPAGTGGAIKITGKSGGLHSRLAAAQKEGTGKIADPDAAFRAAAQAIKAKNSNEVQDPLTALNRIAIMADVSGSMGSAGTPDDRTPKITHLQNALLGFNNQVDFENTSVAIYTFPYYERDEEEEFSDLTGGVKRGVKYRLTTDKLVLDLAIQGLTASGGTPMTQTMDRVLAEIPLTRGIIISDGEADNPAGAITTAQQYAKAETIIDCIHIGDSASGENLLAEIARITGGLYIKFDKVENFAKAFSFLSPAGRATLRLTGGVGTLEEKAAVARMLGAKEVK